MIEGVQNMVVEEYAVPTKLKGTITTRNFLLLCQKTYVRSNRRAR